MKKSTILYLLFILILTPILSACERERVGCEIEGATAKPPIQLTDLLSQTPEPASAEAPIKVEIKGKMTEVDKLVNYPICNDNWSETVYVNCDAQVAVAELDDDENPLFFKGCNLNIEPNTVVYVAAHNDAPYYKGCSCHTGEAPLP